MSEENACSVMSVQNRMLLMAARENMPKTISALLEEGADIEAADPRDGYTPLLVSAWFGHLENVKVLVNKRANLDAQSNEGGTAMLLAAQRGYVDLVQYLKRAGADVSIADKDGDTPLSAAQKMGHAHVVEFLVRAQSALGS